MNTKLAAAITRASERSHAQIARNIARHAYRITRPGEEPIEVIFHPPQTLDEVRRDWYPNAEVTPA